MENHDWLQLLALKSEMDNNMMAYDWVAQERFTELFVESLRGKGDRTEWAVNRPLQAGENGL